MYLPCISAAAALGANITEKSLLDYPAARNPIEVSSGGASWTWGSWTELLSGIDKEFALVGLVIAGASPYTWRYSLDIGYGDAGSEQPCIGISGGNDYSSGGGTWECFKVIKPFRKFTAGTRLAARLKTSYDGTVSVYIKPVYVETPITEAGALPTWTYKRTITIDNTSGSELTDFPVKVVLDTANFDYSHCKVDGGDIRFYDGQTELSYYMDAWDVSGESIIYVKVPFIPAGGTKTIEMRYGNPEANPVQNPDDVCLIYDTFEQDAVGSPPSKWTVVGTSGSVRVTSSQSYDGNKSLDLESNNNPPDPVGIRKDLALPEMFTVEYYMRPKFGIRYNGLRAFKDTSCAISFYSRYYDPSNARLYYLDEATWVADGTHPWDSWRQLKYLAKVTSYTYDLWLGGVKRATDAGFCNDVAPNRLELRFQSNSNQGHLYLDKIIVRKAADPEPIASLGGEEEL